MSLFDELKRPFDAKKVHWRVGMKKNGRGLALAYVDARDVMQRLDEVMTPAGWQAEYLPPAGNGLVICRLGLFMAHDDKRPHEWVWKSNGAGETQVEGEKGSCSDAFKRAAVLWGVGRYLYYLPSFWVAMNGNQLAETPSLPEWATPEHFNKAMEKRKAA